MCQFIISAHILLFVILQSLDIPICDKGCFELSSLNTNDFFPYFILTDKKIMLFDAEFNNAIVSFDDKIINVHTRKFMARYEKGEKSRHFIFKCS